MSTNGVEQQSKWTPHVNGTTNNKLNNGHIMKTKGVMKNIDEEMDVNPPEVLKGPMKVVPKLLMGPGPSNPSPRILNANNLPIMGHLHDEFYDVSTHFIFS